MKKSLLLSALLSFLFCLLSSQVPQGFTYQAIARDVSGNAIANQTLPVRLTIQSDSLGGTTFWIEEHSSVMTNNLGLFTLILGTGERKTGSSVSSFNEINWSVIPKFIKTEINYGGWKYMGTSRLWSVPYSMVAGDINDTLKKLVVKGETEVMDEALFEVKNKKGQTVLAVYNDGVRIFVNDNITKGTTKGGFAIGGFGTDKAPGKEYFRVTPDSTRVYVDGNNTKGATKGGFAIGGFSTTKTRGQEYLRVTPDSTRIYVNDNNIKGTTKGGFAIGGFDAVKNEDKEYLRVTSDSVKVSKSLLIPRLTTYERDHLSFVPGEALIIFNMTEGCMQIFKNNVWSNIWCFNCAPAFIIQPVDNIICSGSNVNFFVSATGTSLSYQWQESTDNGSSWHNIFNGGTVPAYSGCNNYSLTLTNIPVNYHNFKYRCIVSGSCLPNATSNVVTLNVGSNPPVITSQPANQQLSGSCTANFSIISPGHGVTYKWQQSIDGGSTWNNISDGGSSPVFSGATTTILSLTNVGFTSNNFKYRCIAGNSCGADVTSSPATLTINPTSIITQPVNTQLTTDCNASFSITMPAGYTVSYKWQVSTNGGSSWSDISDGGSTPAYSGVATSVLSLSNVPKSFTNFQYRCIVNSLCGPNEISSAAVLSLNSASMITVPPINELVYAGQNIIFKLTASGNNINYQWQESTNGGGTWSNITDGGSDPAYSGALTASLKLTNVPVTFNNNKYRCILTHYCRPDEISDAVTLSVGTAVPVADNDGNTYNTVGIGSQLWMAENLKTTKYGNGELIGTTTPATLAISGESTPKYQWAYNGDEGNVAIFGRLYTWYAITDSRNVCPVGWHLPSAGEWDKLASYLANNGYCFGLSSNDIAKSLASNSLWQDCWAVGTPGNDQLASNNKSGFNGFPAGYRVHSGEFTGINYTASWWTSTIGLGSSSWNRSVPDVYGILIDYEMQYRMNGYSVRCVKDPAK